MGLNQSERQVPPVCLKQPKRFHVSPRLPPPVPGRWLHKAVPSYNGLRTRSWDSLS